MQQYVIISNNVKSIDTKNCLLISKITSFKTLNFLYGPLLDATTNQYYTWVKCLKLLQKKMKMATESLNLGTNQQYQVQQCDYLVQQCENNNIRFESLGQLSTLGQLNTLRQLNTLINQNVAINLNTPANLSMKSHIRFNNIVQFNIFCSTKHNLRSITRILNQKISLKYQLLRQKLIYPNNQHLRLYLLKKQNQHRQKLQKEKQLRQMPIRPPRIIQSTTNSFKLNQKCLKMRLRLKNNTLVQRCNQTTQNSSKRVGKQLNTEHSHVTYVNTNLLHYKTPLSFSITVQISPNSSIYESLLWLNHNAHQ
ncbi:Hypothetical_protein [Hexamita inflata]|uniref:Hypothetical_protein n=1 Tax=Hexamita inflata TaxID=28002 RepID=A0AA86QMQ1_9EUKA|nr:Hypothetical protein HINF_LOCUS50136 [Hexamita inflata]